MYMYFVVYCRLFNCVYCEFGCYSRYRLETHCSSDHPDKPFKVSNLDKRINSVQVVREEPDGVDVLGELFLNETTSILRVIWRSCKTAVRVKN